MMYSRRFPAAVLVLASLTVAACGGSSEPTGTTPAPSGRFDLVTYEAKPLPDTLRVISGVSPIPGSTGSVTCPEILLGATLDVGPSDGAAPTFTRTSRIGYPCTGTLPRPSDLPDSTTWVEAGHVLDNGLDILLTFDSFADTTSNEHDEVGRIQGADIVIDHVLIGSPGMREDLPSARVYRHE